jgi:hypothetical protein
VEDVAQQTDFIRSRMIEGNQVEMKMLLESKLGIAEADEMFGLKYDCKTAEVLEASVFEQQMQMSNLEASLVSNKSLSNIRRASCKLKSTNLGCGVITLAT